MAKFCTQCGSPLDPATGVCPNCASAAEKEPETSAVSEAEKAENTPPAALEEAASAPAEAGEKPVPEPEKPEEAPAAFQSAPQPFVPPAPAAPASKDPLPPPVQKKEARKAAGAVSPKNGRSTAGKVLLTVLLSFFFFVFCLTALLIGSVRRTVTEESLVRLTDSLTVDEALDFAEAIGADPERAIRGIEEDFDIEIKRSSIDKFIEKSDLIPFLADKASGAFQSIMEGRGEIGLTHDEVFDFLTDNRSTLESVFRVTASRSDLEKVANWLVKSGEEETVTVAKIKEESPGLYYGASVGFSYTTLIGFLLFAALMLFLMFRNSPFQACIGAGAVWMLLGGVPLILTFFSAAIAPLWDAMTVFPAVGVVAANFLQINLILNLAVFFAGVLILAGGVLVRGLLKKKKAA